MACRQVSSSDICASWNLPWSSGNENLPGRRYEYGGWGRAFDSGRTIHVRNLNGVFEEIGGKCCLFGIRMSLKHDRGTLWWFMTWQTDNVSCPFMGLCRCLLGTKPCLSNSTSVISRNIKQSAPNTLPLSSTLTNWNLSISTKLELASPVKSQSERIGSFEEASKQCRLNYMVTRVELSATDTSDLR